MKRLHCLVAADPAHGALGTDLCDTIAREPDSMFAVSLCAHAALEAHPPCDVLIPIIDASHAQDVISRLAAWHIGHQDGVILPLTLGLQRHHLLELFTAGAFDFMTLPLDSQAVLARLHRAVGALPACPAIPLSRMHEPAVRELVGSSPVFLKQMALLPTIAGCDAGVLILGETGTGKEVCARAIHYSSSRSTRPMVVVNCGAIPPDLLESELFGHVRGAFTSAHATRAGLVREAEGGTLFLDEIDSLPMPAQAKLLRFLQDMEFRPVGGDTVFKADVRVIAACNQDLPHLVERGLFRRDLFFRLHVLSIALPPLRERAEDIFPLAQRFIHHFVMQTRRTPIGLSPQAIKHLLAHDWPGNVRELKHVIERAVLLARGAMIQVDDLQLSLADPTQDAAESFHAAKARMVDAFERSYIERLLAASGGNITQAAEAARKNRRALFELMRKHGINAERFRSKARMAS